ncbi:MAG: MarR family transcriptional regulator [Xanthomonadales bacterium]|nr:MarR family transcriptional regulator [Xanthomonadales bacterium]
MNALTVKKAAQHDFMPLMREMVRASQPFARRDAELLRISGSGLTVSQADVIFTLGNTSGMSCGEIGERTLITKGTLTGVIDRLEARDLVQRRRGEHDARCTHVALTPAGETLFEQAFPRHIAALKPHFDRLSPERRERAQALLAEIRAAFS